MKSLAIDNNSDHSDKILKSASVTRFHALLLVWLLLLQCPYSTTALAAASRRRRHQSSSSPSSNNFSRVKNQWKRNSGGILDYERSVLEKKDNDGNSMRIAYVLGSDEAGRGCIAGPVVAATCCILPLRNDDIVEEGSRDQDMILDLEQRLESLLQCNGNDRGEIKRSNNLIRDSKQLSPSERERIFDVIVENPDLFAYSVAQRSNVDIDERQNILLATMDCFQESIEELACKKLPSDCRYNRVDRSSPEDNTTIEPPHLRSTAYSIVDGKKTPKLSLSPMLPCRPYVNADAEIFTVSLASIIAKVTRDRLAESWHDEFPQYGFLKHKGYATKDHVEAIHKNGPCPLHRMTFKTLKGR